MSIADPGVAYDAAGHRVRDVLVVDTQAGSTPHLAWGGTDIAQTFCGLDIGAMSRTWFGLAGCAKCRRSARKQGVARITDVDGELVDL